MSVFFFIIFFQRLSANFRDFSIGMISELNLKMNLLQKSALNFSIVSDYNEDKILNLHEKVKDFSLYSCCTNLGILMPAEFLFQN